jgi:Asp-tRNA(Asn)/Glu-tRNA(Gln) amidotransferase A subunit family amidase
MTVRELGTQIRARTISCVELIEQTLKDIRERDKFCSLITVTGEQALATARETDAELAAGKDRGPFHGIPIAFKDLFYTRGVKHDGGFTGLQRFCSGV